jgi:hypothetical protein
MFSISYGPCTSRATPLIAIPEHWIKFSRIARAKAFLLGKFLSTLSFSLSLSIEYEQSIRMRNHRNFSRTIIFVTYFWLTVRYILYMHRGAKDMGIYTVVLITVFMLLSYSILKNARKSLTFNVNCSQATVNIDLESLPVSNI